jgi:trypsin
MSSGGTVSDVSSIIYHPNWVGMRYTTEDVPVDRDACLVDDDGPRSDTNAYDFAIWKLTNPISSGDNIGYSTLPEADSDPSAGTPAFTAGW